MPVIKPQKGKKIEMKSKLSKRFSNMKNSFYFNDDISISERDIGNSRRNSVSKQYFSPQLNLTETKRTNFENLKDSIERL